MFETENTINQMMLQLYQQTVADIPEERIYEAAPGNGQPPVWVMGHLAICAELGLKFCGEDLVHPEWVATFGPGSSNQIAPSDQYSKQIFSDVILQQYPRLAEQAAQLDADTLNAPHGVALLEPSPLNTIGDLLAHLLTSHTFFHLAQLSGWRRAAGFAHLF